MSGKRKDAPLTSTMPQILLVAPCEINPSVSPKRYVLLDFTIGSCRPTVKAITEQISPQVIILR